MASLSSCLQYLLYTDGHLSPTFILAEVSVHVPSALPTAEMSSLILVGSFQPCPVSQLEFSWASELFGQQCTCSAYTDSVLSRPLHSKSNLVISPIVYQTQVCAIRTAKSLAWSHLRTDHCADFLPYALANSPFPHTLVQSVSTEIVLLSVLSASPISLPLSCSTSETQLISFQCLSVSPTALIC